jgi:hypothetical protein
VTSLPSLRLRTDCRAETNHEYLSFPRVRSRNGNRLSGCCGSRTQRSVLRFRNSLPLHSPSLSSLLRGRTRSRCEPYLRWDSLSIGKRRIAIAVALRATCEVADTAVSRKRNSASRIFQLSFLIPVRLRSASGSCDAGILGTVMS